MPDSRRVVLIVVLAFALASQSIHGQDEVPTERSGSGGILGLFFSPIKATIDTARKLLGIPVSNARDFVVDGIDEIQMQTFRLFMMAYNKTYESPAEIRRHMLLYFDRRKMIEKSIRDFASGRLPFMMRENAFTDMDDSGLKALASSIPPRPSEMTPDELEVKLRDRDQGLQMGQIGDEEEPMVTSALYSDDEPDEDFMDRDDTNMTVMAQEWIPKSKDWRLSGCVGQPIDQKKCGACYAISTMETVETMRCLKNMDSSPKLSPQQVIDCSTPRAGYQNHGCNGGWPTRVLKYLQDVRVAARDSCYPFVRRQQYCQLRAVQNTKGCTVKASPTDTSLTYRILNNEKDIQYHVAKTGPVITVMKALDTFLFYSKGIYDDPKCARIRRDDVDHAIVIVGYGRENNMDYWIIKNSWGTDDWGEGGYGKYRRGRNVCSIGSWGWVITS